MRAIVFERNGGPEVLEVKNVPAPEPGPDEVLIDVEAVGVNYRDVYERRGGGYGSPPPAIIGVEGAGQIHDTGERVAWANVAGSYAEQIAAPREKLVPVPDTVSTEGAAAALLQGMTAYYLATDSYPVHPGDWVLVHAGAGGVGLLLTQIAKVHGGRVIATTSTDEKARLAREAGADEVILYTQTDFESGVKRLTAGRGVQVVYDSIGKATFDKSLDCLAPRGYMVLFGNASGPVPPFDAQVLGQRGSLFLTRPGLVNYTATVEELNQRAGDVLGWVASGRLRLRIEAALPLAEAIEAHRRLSARETAGKLLLLPA